MKKRVLIHAMGIMAMLFVSLLFFQNCARQAFEPDPVAFSTRTEVEDDLVYALKNAPDPKSICDDLDSYTCEARSYGPGLENVVLNEKVCIEGGCVEVLNLAFDTEQQIAACKGCSEKEIRDRYDHDSLMCMNRRVPIGRSLPLQAEGEDVAAAIKAVKAKCHALAGAGT